MIRLGTQGPWLRRARVSKQEVEEVRGTIHKQEILSPSRLENVFESSGKTTEKKSSDGAMRDRVGPNVCQKHRGSGFFHTAG